MGTDDLKSMFKAAKAQRGSGGSMVGAPARLFYKDVFRESADMTPCCSVKSVLRLSCFMLV